LNRKAEQKSCQFLCRDWGFSHLGRQTECERIPRPRNKYRIMSAGVTSAPAVSSTLRGYVIDALEVPHALVRVHFF
jgi:hypothetical protein